MKDLLDRLVEHPDGEMKLVDGFLILRGGLLRGRRSEVLRDIVGKTIRVENRKIAAEYHLP